MQKKNKKQKTNLAHVFSIFNVKSFQLEYLLLYHRCMKVTNFYPPFLIAVQLKLSNRLKDSILSWSNKEDQMCINIFFQLIFDRQTRFPALSIKMWIETCLLLYWICWSSSSDLVPVQAPLSNVKQFWRFLNRYILSLLLVSIIWFGRL